MSQKAADGLTDFMTSMAKNARDVAYGAAGYVAGLFKDKKKERVGHITIAENDITAKAFQLGKFSGLKGEELANAVNYQEVTNEYGGTGVLVLDANGKVIREIWNGAEGSFNIFDSNGKLARIKNLPAGADDAGFLDPIDNPIAGILKNILKGSSRTILKAIDKKVVKETIEEGAKGGTSEILSWGKKAKGHLVKHADALGFGGYTSQQLQKMLPQLRSAANQLYNNVNPALTRIGRWGGQADDVLMHITNNGKMLVTKQNGEFITVINKTSNNWYQLAKPLR